MSAEGVEGSVFVRGGPLAKGVAEGVCAAVYVREGLLAQCACRYITPWAFYVRGRI